MNFNKPPFHDPVIDMQMPPKIRPPDKRPTKGIGLVETPMAEVWANYHAVLNNELSSNLGENGYIFPAVNTATLNNNLPKFGQSMVYNQDLNRMELNNGNRSNPGSRAPTSEAIQTYGGLSGTQIATEAVKPENNGRIFVNTDTNELQFSIDGATIRTITST